MQMCALGVLAFCLSTGASLAVPVPPPYYIGEILPTPKKAVYQDRFIPVYDPGAPRASATLLVGPGEPARLAAQNLAARIAELAGVAESAIVVQPLSETIPDGQLIVLGTASDPAVNRLASQKGVSIQPPQSEQGYIIRAVKDGERSICLACGSGAMGTYFAAMSLRQLLKVDTGKVLLRAADIDDWPTFELRGTCCYAPEQADWLAAAKFSTLDYNYGSVGTNAWRDPDRRGIPPGWGHYSGAGSLEVRATDESPHTGTSCVSATVAAFYKWPDKPPSVSAGLMLGGSDGYTGKEALPATPGKYHLTIWLRGTVPKLELSVTAWTGPDGKSGERKPIGVTPAIAALTPDWQEQAFDFELPAELQTFAVQFRVNGGTADGVDIGKAFHVDDAVLRRDGNDPNLAVNGDVESTGKTYTTKINALWDWAVPRGLWPMQFVNPLEVSGWETDGALKIQVSDPRQIDDLARTFRISLDRGGTWVMLALDDFASRLGGPAPYYVITNEADKTAFKSLGECHGALTRELYRRLISTHPRMRMIVCPAYYWTPKGGYQQEGEAYLREFGSLLPPEVLILWTGPNVRSRTITREQAEQFTGLIGRKPYLWDNTIYARHSDPTYVLDPFDSVYPERFWELTAGGLHNNGGVSELYRVGCLVYGDYAWNPEAYDPKASLDKALRMVLGEGCADAAHAFRDHYYAVRDPHLVLTRDISSMKDADLVQAVGPLTREQIAEIAGHVDAMDAALRQLQATSPNQPLLAALGELAAPLRAAAAELRKRGDLTATGVQKLDHGIRLADWSFVGGAGHQVYDNHCQPKRATWVYGKQTPTHTMTAAFNLDNAPGTATLVIAGQNTDKGGPTRVEVALNGTSLFSGPNPCPKQGWSEWRIELSAALLKSGSNTLVIRNLEDSASTNASWFMLSEARIVWP